MKKRRLALLASFPHRRGSGMRRCDRSISLLVVVAAFATQSLADTITQTNFDASARSSLVEGANWSNGQPPSAGNDYVSAKVIRTPTVATNLTFAGDSLTFNSGGNLYFRGAGTSSTYTFSALTLKGTAYIQNGMGVATYFRVSGNLALDSTLTNGFSLNNAGNGGGFEIAAAISGAGRLRVYSNGSSLSPVAIALTHAANSYAGGTLVSSNGYLVVKPQGTLGTGNVTVAAGALLALEHGTAVDDNAMLELQVIPGVSTGKVDVVAGAVEDVGRISLGGTVHTQRGMTFGSTSSGAAYQDNNYFGGTGVVRIQPAKGTLVQIL